MLSSEYSTRSEVEECEDFDITTLFDLPSQLDAELAPHTTKLPPELLAEIFVLCTPETVSLPPSTDDPLLALTQICHSWRDLALVTPELWANVSVVLAEHKIDWVTKLSAQWLSRTGEVYPLSVTAKCSAGYATTVCDNPELVAPFVRMIISHASRLRFIDLEFPSATLLPLFALPSDAFSRLEKATLRPLLRMDDMAVPEPGSSLGWHWPSTAVALDSAPRIQEVTFSPKPLFNLAELETAMPDTMEAVTATTNVAAASHPFFAPLFALPWSKLSVVSFPFTALTPNAWCSILMECHQLMHFEVAIKPSPNDEHPVGDLQQIHLDHLIYLSVSAFCGGGDELVDRLTAPRLVLLSLLGTEFPMTSFLSFQRRSNFMLETFMPIVPIPAADAERVFEHLPDLKTLIVLAVSTEHFPDSLWARVGRAELFPQLRALVIRPTAAQAPVLVDMIAARWEANTEPGLPIVRFGDVRPAHLEAVNEELRRLSKYAERGQTVELVTLC